MVVERTPTEQFPVETSGETDDQNSTDDPIENGTQQMSHLVSSLSAREYRKSLARLIDQHLMGVENILKEKIPLGEQREQALRPFQTAVDKLKVEIACLPWYAIVEDSLYSVLENAKLLNSTKLERTLDYLEKLHVASVELQTLTGTNTPGDAQTEIKRSFATIERFCELYNITQGDWHRQLEEVISENNRLKTELDDLKNNIQLQDIPMEEEEELMRTDEEKRESRKFDFLDRFDEGDRDLFQEPMSNRSGQTSNLTPRPRRQVPSQPNLPIQSEQFNRFDQLGSHHTQSFLPTNPSEWYFKAQALPPLESFRGQEEKSLDDFLDEFDAKYSPNVFTDTERRNLFVRLLRDNAKRAYKSLDDAAQRSSLASIVAKMRSLLTRDAQVTSINATRQIESLKLLPDQLTSFCDRLEQLTRQAYPSMPAEEISFIRAEQLYRRITHWDNSIEALRILESTPRAIVYSSLKKLVFQLERSRQHHLNLQSSARNVKSFKKSSSHPSANVNSGSGDNQNSSKQTEPTPNIACYECGQEGHYRRNCPKQRSSQNQQNGRHQGDRPPTSQSTRNPSVANTRGNQSSNQNSSNYRQNNYNSNQGRNDRPVLHSIDSRPCPDSRQSMSQSDDVESNKGHLYVLDHSPDRLNVNSLINVASSVNSLVVNDLVYFGDKPMYNVKIGELTGTALIDSGAQPSTMTLCTYRHIIETLPDAEKYLRILDPLPGKPQPIYNASGVEMSIKAVVLMHVRLLATQKEAPIVFHIIRDKPSDGPKELILGTNAFPTLGVRLAFDAPITSVPPTFGSTEHKKQVEQKESHEVIVAKRIELFPSEARWIPLEMTNFSSFGDREAVVSSTIDDFGREIFDQAVCRFDDQGNSRILMSNNSSNVMILAKGQLLGRATTAKKVYSMSALHVPEVMECLAVEAEPPQIEQTVDKGDRLLEIMKEQHDEMVPQEIIDIVMEFSEYFAIDDGELRQTQMVLHDIDTGTATPIRQKVRPVPVGVRKQFKEIIDSLLERKVIEHSSSPWASPIVLVVKKDGTLRLCIDYRQLNKVIELDAYPLPSIEGILQSLNGKKYFSTLDLFAGFWQIGLKDSARPKTAFITTEGLYQFRVVPFGLATSPATFQRLMNKVLGRFMTDTREVHIYIDDVLIATDTKERHFVVLKEVMSALSSANLAVKIAKCKFLQESVQYLGHKIDGAGIHTDPAKVEVIKKAQPPRNLKELRSFLGLSGYYRRFIFKFASIAKPLFELTKSNRQFVWSTECDEAFHKLKEALCTAPVLSQPDVEGGLNGSNPFVIFTDASGTGIGAVLSQRGPDSLLHPLWFMSKSLTKAETRYHATDLEALAAVAALKKFQSILYNMKGTVLKTDHQGLLSMFKKQVSPRMLRWSLLIQHFNVRIEYVKGKANAAADALSRGMTPPLPESTNESTVCDDLENIVVASVQNIDRGWLTELTEDTSYGPLIKFLGDNRQLDFSNDKDVDRRSIELTPDISMKEGHRKLTVNDFCLENDHLWLCIDTEEPRRVVPHSRRRALFDEAHAGIFAGHFSAKKIHRLLKHSFFWENMARDIHTWHRSCSKCFLTNVQETLVPPLRPITTSKPYELVGVDLMELGLTTSGNKYVLVLIDHFSKWIGAYPIPSKSADVVAKTIVNRWLGEGRWPKSFLSDQGPEFLNEIMDSLRKLTKIQWSVTKGYCPRENGLTERANQTLQRCLRKILDHPAEWDMILPFVTFAYNCTSHSSTGDSPFFILHGFDPQFPLVDDIPERTVYQQIDYSQYKECLVDSIRESHNIVKERLSKEMERCKAYYDRRHKTDNKRYPVVGDRVFVRLPPSRTGSKFPKLAFNIKGPYRVIETSNNSALLTLLHGNDEPIRIQFDLILIVPPGLDAPEYNPKRRRKVVPKTLGFIETETVGTIAQVNSIYCRVVNTATKMNVSMTMPGHPLFVCTGEVDMQGRTLLCQITNWKIKDLANLVTFDIPEGCLELPLATTAAIARAVSILECQSIHQAEKEKLLVGDQAFPISINCWIRSYHLAMLQCRHVREFFQANGTKELSLIRDFFRPEVHLSDKDYRRVGHEIFEPPAITLKHEDIMMFPKHRLFMKVDEMVTTHGKLMTYDDQGAILSEFFKSPQARYVWIMLSTLEKPEELSPFIKQVQEAAKMCDKMAVFLMPPVMKHPDQWLDFSSIFCQKFTEFKQRCHEDQEIPRIHWIADTKEKLNYNSPWMLLGSQLAHLSPQGQLSVVQINAFIDHLRKFAKEDHTKLKITIHRRLSRQIPDDGPSQRHQEHRQSIGQLTPQVRCQDYRQDRRHAIDTRQAGPPSQFRRYDNASRRSSSRVESTSKRGGLQRRQQ